MKCSASAAAFPMLPPRAIWCEVANTTWKSWDFCLATTIGIWKKWSNPQFLLDGGPFLQVKYFVYVEFMIVCWRSLQVTCWGQLYGHIYSAVFIGWIFLWLNHICPFGDSIPMGLFEILMMQDLCFPSEFNNDQVVTPSVKEASYIL